MKPNTQSRTGKKLAIVVVALVAMALAIFSLIPEGTPSRRAMGARLDHFAYAAGYGLGQHLASAFPKARVRVLLSPQDDAVMPAGKVAAGLEASLRGRVQSLERVWLSGGVVPSVEDMRVASEPSALEDAIGEWEAETDLMVLLFEPPPGLLQAPEEGREGKPALAVVCANVLLLLDPIEKGVVSAAVAAKPDARLHEDGRLIEPPEDPEEAFALGFEVVTPKNVGDFRKRYPHLIADGHHQPGN